MKLKPKSCWHSIMPNHLRAKSATQFNMLPKVTSIGSSPGKSPVYLNVYDLTPVNGYVYWAGLGVFHTGLEVHGVEYAFGAHEYSASGIFQVEPWKCPGFKFRKSIFMGMTYMNPIQVREFMKCQSANYYGDTYHLVVKNCNHFSEDMCYKLTGKQIPKWVNRLAKIGSFCNCVLPEAHKAAAVRQDPDFQGEYVGEKKRLRGSFSCFSSISTHPKEKVLIPSLSLP